MCFRVTFGDVARVASALTWAVGGRPCPPPVEQWSARGARLRSERAGDGRSCLPAVVADRRHLVSCQVLARDRHHATRRWRAKSR